VITLWCRFLQLKNSRKEIIDCRNVKVLNLLRGCKYLQGTQGSLCAWFYIERYKFCKKRNLKYSEVLEFGASLNPNECKRNLVFRNLEVAEFLSNPE
jgi:hypothetical protein